MLTSFIGIANAQHERHCQKPFHTNHRERIYDGWRSGELTPYEIRQLKADQCRFQLAKRRMLHDGRLDAFERRKLNKMKRHFSEKIWREKHDRERRRHW